MKNLVRSAIVILVCMLLPAAGCATGHGEGFAIYLTEGDIPPSQMEALSHINITEEPVIGIDDIISYDTTTHEITLIAGTFKRVSNLEVPIRGKSFVVCVDRNPLYWGAFWTPISSISFEGVTIWKPFGSPEEPVIKIELGYPSSSFYAGEDPRNNAEVMDSLKQAGKLITIDSELPHSLKGYELYSWEDGGRWHFTLITGTNRNKTPEEVTSVEDIISEDGWVHIHVIGEEAIKAVLSRIPQNEFVSWLTGLQVTSGETKTLLQLPPESMVNTIKTIKDHAAQCGLAFYVPGY